MVLGADAAVGVLRQTLFAFERKSSALLIADDAASADDIEVRSKFVGLNLPYEVNQRRFWYTRRRLEPLATPL